MIRLVLLDVDQTLANHIPSNGEAQLPARVLAELAPIQRLIEHYPQVRFAFCSGRSARQLKAVAKEFPSVRQAVTENGAVLAEFPSLEQHPLPLDEKSKHLLERHYTCAKEFGAEKRIPEKISMLSMDVYPGENPGFFNDFIRFLPPELYQESLGLSFQFSWDPTAVNISTRLNKAAGCQALAEKLGIDLKTEALYIGDGTSDRPAMERCAFAGCPRNPDDSNNRELCLWLERGKQQSHVASHPFGEGSLEVLRHFAPRFVGSP